MSDEGQKCPLCGSMVRTEGRELVPATERDEFMRWVMSLPEWSTMTVQQLVELWTQKVAVPMLAATYRRVFDALSRPDAKSGS